MTKRRAAAARVEDHATPEQVMTQGRGGFPVVGIGASAGGLDAFSKLLQALPSDCGMTFVLIQPLDPKHSS
ncbi:MAG: chemotaxis protein CheB, partial [Xanthobacteraceae bacterium]